MRPTGGLTITQYTHLEHLRCRLIAGWTLLRPGQRHSNLFQAGALGGEHDSLTAAGDSDAHGGIERATVDAHSDPSAIDAAGDVTLQIERALLPASGDL